MKAPFPYVGGKSRLVERIKNLIPEHTTYCELFAGALWVFFGKEHSKVEIINDLNGDLITFYKCVKAHPEEFARQFDFVLCSRELFKDYKMQMNVHGLTDIQRAARFFYLQKLAFGGKVTHQSFGVAGDRPARINFSNLDQDIAAISRRLAKTIIENLSWEKCLAAYDSTETFFYLDPPYYKKPAYKFNFEGVQDFELMGSVLKGIKGKFLLSLNDEPEIREVFKDFSIEEASVLYSISKGTCNKGKELLISNYELQTSRAA